MSTNHTAFQRFQEEEEDTLPDFRGEPGSPLPRVRALPFHRPPPSSEPADRKSRFHEFLRKELTEARTEAEKEVILTLLREGADPLLVAPQDVLARKDPSEVPARDPSAALRPAPGPSGPDLADVAHEVRCPLSGGERRSPPQDTAHQRSVAWDAGWLPGEAAGGLPEAAPP